MTSILGPDGTAELLRALDSEPNQVAAGVARELLIAGQNVPLFDLP